MKKEKEDNNIYPIHM